MITIEEIEQGQFKAPAFQIFSDEGVTPFNLSTLTNVYVWFTDGRTGEELKKYSMNAATGHDNTHFVIVNAAQGQFKINIESSVTAEWGDRLVRFEISIQSTQSGFTNPKTIAKENIYKVKPNLIHNI